MMTLTLITGPANSAKAGEVFAAYAAASRRGAVLVVPTARDVRHYERELAAAGGERPPVVLGSVLTFDGLVARIAERAGYAGRRLSALQRGQLLRSLVERLRRDGLDALGSSARGPGFALAAGELIAELQRSLITPQRFTQALRGWAAQDVRRAGFTHDLGRIYSGYARELDALGRVDRELFAWRALDALRADPQSWARPTPDAVFIYGFDDLTPLERDAVETLTRIPGVEVTVSLTYEPGRTALRARAESLEELRPLAGEVRELPASDAHYAPGARDALHRLERDLFQDTAPETHPSAAPAAGADEVVTLLEAGGARAEAELVASEILALATAGMELAQIVVVHRSPASSAGLFARVLGGYGIPLAAARSIELRHTPLGRALLGAARCAWLGGEAAPADLLAYLRAPGLLQRRDVADALEAEIRQVPLTTVAAAREALGWELGELDSLALAGRSDGSGAGDPALSLPLAPGAASELRRLAQRLLVAPHRGAAAQLDGDEELDARACATLVRGLEELDELAAGGRRLRLSAAEMLELIGSLAVEISTADETSAESVLLAAPAEIRARRFRAVFICGMQEGEFPAPGRPEPFLSDERRRELAIASGATCSTRRSRAQPSASSCPTAARTKRATSRSPRRSSPTLRRRWAPGSISGRAGAAGCSPMSPGRRPRRRPSGRPSAPRPPPGPRSPAIRPSPRGDSARRRSPMSATRGWSRRERSSATPIARSAGWWRPSSIRRRWSPRPSRWLVDP
jgi:ADDB, N-terminal